MIYKLNKRLNSSINTFKSKLLLKMVTWTLRNGIILIVTDLEKQIKYATSAF